MEVGYPNQAECLHIGACTEVVWLDAALLNRFPEPSGPIVSSKYICMGWLLNYFEEMKAVLELPVPMVLLLVTWNLEFDFCGANI